VKPTRLHGFLVIISLLLIFPIFLTDNAKAALVPDWVKDIAKFYGADQISESEFLNAIKFLIENDILVLDKSDDEEIIEEGVSIPLTAEVIIPNGNAQQSNTSFYRPLHLQVKVGTTVEWFNNDNVLHTIQSQDENGKPSGLFNSNVLKSGETFTFKFEEPGLYNYYCTLHPWRVGQVTVI
jgi:plastocyanin